MKWLPVAGLLMASACSMFRAPVVGESAPAQKDPADENRWQQTLERYTDHKAIYDGLDSRLFAAATWQSPQLVDARVRRECDFRGLPESATRARLAAEQSRLAAVTEVHLGVHVADYHFEDFGRSDSMWSIALVKDGVEVTPTKVTRNGKARLHMRAIYPYLDEFWVSYDLQFPKVVVAPGDKLTMRMASSIGRAEFEFKAE